jgi:hypothetical protein
VLTLRRCANGAIWGLAGLVCRPKLGPWTSLDGSQAGCAGCRAKGSPDEVSTRRIMHENCISDGGVSSAWCKIELW